MQWVAMYAQNKEVSECCTYKHVPADFDVGFGSGYWLKHPYQVESFSSNC